MSNLYTIGYFPIFIFYYSFWEIVIRKCFKKTNHHMFKKNKSDAYNDNEFAKSYWWKNKLYHVLEREREGGGAIKTCNYISFQFRMKAKYIQRKQMFM